MRRLAVVLLVGVALATTGCLDVEESLTLNRNLSGQAGLVMNMDMTPLVPFMAQMQRQMAGQSGAPTPADLAAAKAELLKNADQSYNFDRDKQDLETHLPPGVRLLSATSTRDGLKASTHIRFGFDNLAGLNRIMFDQSSGQQGSRGPGNPVSKPFNGLRVVDNGGTILITSAIIDPMTDAKTHMQQMPMNGPLRQEMEAILQGFRVVVKITAPFHVLEQNATRREGNTLIWEFDAARLKTLTPSELAAGIRVRYQK